MRQKLSGENANAWRGDAIKYSGLHLYARRTFGKSSICEHCNQKFDGRHINWATKDGKYTRGREDWIRVCVSCHRKHDYKMRKQLGVKGLYAYV